MITQEDVDKAWGDYFKFLDMVSKDFDKDWGKVRNKDLEKVRENAIDVEKKFKEQVELK